MAIENFVAAYRIDRRIRICNSCARTGANSRRGTLELAKSGFEELKKRYIALMRMAGAKMKSWNSNGPLRTTRRCWTSFPTIPRRGRPAQREMAISNRLKYEKIQLLLAAGIVLFGEKKYKDARNDFDEVLTLDIKNREAKRYRPIDELLRIQQDMELKRIRRKQFYLSGIEKYARRTSIRRLTISRTALSLIKNYKDARARLDGLDASEGIRRGASAAAAEEHRPRLPDGLWRIRRGDTRRRLSSWKRRLPWTRQRAGEKYIVMVKEGYAI